MYYVGYIYRYWAITEDLPIAKIYKLALLDFMISMYGFYHTQGEEYVIEDTKDRARRVMNKVLHD